jgi:hypothetical protein
MAKFSDVDKRLATGENRKALSVASIGIPRYFDCAAEWRPPRLRHIGSGPNLALQ